MDTDPDNLADVADPPPSSEVGCRPTRPTTEGEDGDKWKLMLEQQNLNFMSLLAAMNTGKNTIILPEFDPDKNDVDARSWITTADICMVDGTVQGSTLMIALSRALKGQASAWLSLISFPGMTWGEFKEIFIARYDCPETPAAFLINLNNGSPKEGECLAAYSARLMTSLLSRWKNLSTEQIAVSIILAHVGRFEKRVQRLAFTSNIDNRNQLQQELRAITFLKRRSGPGEDDAVNEKRFKPAVTHQPIQCYRCGKLGHRAMMCRAAVDIRKKNFNPSASNEQHYNKDRGTASTTVTCFRCGHAGHYSSRCPQHTNPGPEVGAGRASTIVEKRVDVCAVSAPAGHLVHSVAVLAVTVVDELEKTTFHFDIPQNDKGTLKVNNLGLRGVVFQQNTSRSLLHQKRSTKFHHSIRSIDYKKTRRKWSEEDFSPTLLFDFSNRSKRNIGPGHVIITNHFNEAVISPGEEISLQCTATGDRPPRFLWERDGVIVSTNTDARYTLGQMMSHSGVGVITQLNISRSRVEDGGLYSCIAIEGETSSAHVDRIDVYGPPYIRTLPPIKVQSGEPLKLRCPYYGFPISKLEWEHRGKKIVTTSLSQPIRYKRSYKYYKGRRKTTPQYLSRLKRQIFETNEEGVLNIARVLKEENGETYTCIVYSPSGEMARRSFEIQVVEAPELDELRVGSGLKERQIVQITCNIITGDPPIYFSWLKDGKKIPATLKINERSSDLFSVLIIKKVSLEHCGKYTCVATNHVGKVNQTADLYINVAPKWMDEPTNSSLLLGQRGVVFCNANGYPTPQIHWMKRDAALGIWRPVLDLAGGGIMSFPNGTLIIEVVSLSDEGLYSCNVENGVGEPLNKNLWISVNKPVHFESLGSNLTTKPGLPVTLSCSPLGDNPIRIKWSVDGKPVDLTTSRITASESMTHNGLKNTINIHYAESRDAGEYECRASNPYGVATYNIRLSILEPPPPPLDLQVDSVTSNSAKLSWRDTISTHVQYYTVQYTSTHFLVWDSASSVNVSRQEKSPRQSVTLVSLIPAREYRARVCAGNPLDTSPYTHHIHFTTHQEAPSSPPLGVSVSVGAAAAGALAVSWRAPPADAQHGALHGYLVRAHPAQPGDPETEESQTKVQKVLSTSGKHETVLTGLLKNTRYAVSVSAFNSAGNGPFSSPVYQTTREGAPEKAPSGVECRGVSSTSLRVAWQPILAQATSLLGYSVLFGTDDGSWQNITSPHTELYLQSLMKYTNYTVKVAGFSNYGVGPLSYPVVCTTLQDVPGPPSAIKALVSSPTSLLISWQKPEKVNGEITHYTVYVKPVSSSSATQSYRVDVTAVKELTFPLTSLTTGKQYEVSVSAHTVAGEGPHSTLVHVELTNKVVAGVSSLGGSVSVGVGRSVLLWCACVGIPPPRTVWYHNHNIITHHPRFTRNQDDSLLINNIDASLSGNYTCLAKNLFGSDSVRYVVRVWPRPPAPRAAAAAPRHAALLLRWDHAGATHPSIVYNLSWKESNASWQDSWSSKGTSVQGVNEYTIEGLKCGTKYSVKITASNNVGESQPTILDTATLGGVPLAPKTTEWFWSNATHIFIQLSGWDDGGCEISKWEVEYSEFGSKSWKKAENGLQQDQWGHYSSILSHTNSYVISSLYPARWYHIRVRAFNSAGVATQIYSFATTTELGETIGPPSELLDLNTLVIVCSSILLTICSFTCIYILVKRHNHNNLTEYRNSLTAECKSERSNITVNTPQSVPNDANRVYSTPIHLNDNKHELYEISPYAQFALGFRTFGHVDNQEPNRMHAPGNSKERYDSETSFQMRSESEESDCVSRTTTLKSAPRKACRVPHHR